MPTLALALNIKCLTPITMDKLKNGFLRMVENYRLTRCPRLRSVNEEKLMDEKLDDYMRKVII